MLLLQVLEALIQLLVPGIQDKDLEGESGGCDEEVGEGDAAGDENHFCFVLYDLVAGVVLVGFGEVGLGMGM